MSSRETPLPGGTLSDAVRVGNTVHRATGPWTATVHHLLRHLEAVGFPYSPRVLGFDELGREVLTYIEGETFHPGGSPWIWSNEALRQIAAVVRSYHDSVADFPSLPGDQWQGTADDRPATVICHNDLSPNNIVWRDNEIVGLIDWDLACPGNRHWDLAFLTWKLVPIVMPRSSDPPSLDVDAVGRIRLLLDSYGLEDRSGILSTVRDRIASSVRGIEHRAAAGEAAYETLVARGVTQRLAEDADYLSTHIRSWERLILDG